MLTRTDITAKCNAFQDELSKSIIDAFKELNIACISFANNGNSSDYDVTRAFFIDDINLDNLEILAICCEDNTICITTDKHVTREELNLLEEHDLFAVNGEHWDSEKMDRCFMPLEGVAMDYCGALVELALAVSEIANELLDNKPITRDINFEEYNKE